MKGGNPTVLRGFDIRVVPVVFSIGFPLLYRLKYIINLCFALEIMIYEEFKNIKTDRTVKALIGMSREKFNSLVPYFSSAYREIQEEQCQNKEIKRLPASGKKGVFASHEERLFFVLFYLKTYPTFDVLGFHFGLSAGHAHDYIKFFTRVLNRALDDMKMLPEQEVKSPQHMALQDFKVSVPL